MTARRQIFNQQSTARPREVGCYYQRYLRRYFAFVIPPGSRVLEVGCGLGDLLAAVQPSHGLGIDFSTAMIGLARVRHPNLEFQVGDAVEFSSDEKFDYIVLADLVNDLPDVQAVLERLRDVSHSGTRLVLNFFSNLWRPILNMAERIGLKGATPLQNWLSGSDMANLLHLADWELVKTDARLLWPANTPVLAPILNRWVAPLFRHLCLTTIIVARPKPQSATRPHFTCSVIIPARNEAGNIEAAIQRTPEMGLGTEIIFIEGHSKDETWEEIRRAAARHPDRRIKILKQQSVGKGGAVREAFAAATGDLLFILDADLTMPPEELPKFYALARAGTSEFVNGVRLVYPMEHEAMRFLNMVANKFFGLAFSWLLGQHLKDTLCGTKVLFRADYEAIARQRSYFGDFDPFGDFDLLFGAAKLNLRMLDVPIRYQARTYGQTNIQRWRHGWLLLKMTVFAALRLKFLDDTSIAGGVEPHFAGTIPANAEHAARVPA